MRYNTNRLTREGRVLENGETEQIKQTQGRRNFMICYTFDQLTAFYDGRQQSGAAS